MAINFHLALFLKRKTCTSDFLGGPSAHFHQTGLYLVGGCLTIKDVTKENVKSRLITGKM